MPRALEDVGHGYGKWGFLIREALDFAGDRHRRSEWSVRIDGLTRSHNALRCWLGLYDDLNVADVLTLTPGINDYDLVILGDVIEHMEKAAGVRLLGALLAWNRCVLVTTPRSFFPQHDIGGNPFERHRSHWSVRDFARWAGRYRCSRRGLDGRSSRRKGLLPLG